MQNLYKTTGTAFNLKNNDTHENSIYYYVTFTVGKFKQSKIPLF